MIALGNSFLFSWVSLHSHFINSNPEANPGTESISEVIIYNILKLDSSYDSYSKIEIFNIMVTKLKINEIIIKAYKKPQISIPVLNLKQKQQHK